LEVSERFGDAAAIYNILEQSSDYLSFRDLLKAASVCKIVGLHKHKIVDFGEHRDSQADEKLEEAHAQQLQCQHEFRFVFCRTAAMSTN
jgi:hypothetical protein